MSNSEFNIFRGNPEDISLHDIQSTSIKKFSYKSSNQMDSEHSVVQQYISDPSLQVCQDITPQEDTPALHDIMHRLPRKEFLKTICKTPGIFLIANYIFNDKEKSQLLCHLHSDEPIDVTNHLYKRLISTSDSTIQEAKREYIKSYTDKSSLVLTAITECAPIVIAAHRTEIESVGFALCQNGTHQAPDIDGLLRIPYTDVKRLLQNPSFLGSKSESTSKEDSADMRLALLREINIFRSSDYSLVPYFDAELQLLKETSEKDYQKGLEILERTVRERNGIAPMGTKGIQTKIPTSYVKQMSFLARQVFDKMPPCEKKRVYNRSNIFSKGSQTNHSPILSLHTWNGEPLTRAHGEVYDAVCTLWLAGNTAVTDQMIARTIWPRTSRKGSETFSETELETIRELMNDLRQAYVTIDASTELRKYKKIGKDDFWRISNFAIPCTVVYQTINGGQYPHRAYKLLGTPVFFAYSAALTQILSIPIATLNPHKSDQNRSPRTLRAAQVRTLILERLHHFHSPSYKKKEHTILFDRIYEVYGIDNEFSGNNTLKKERMAARKTVINILQTFKLNGLIKGFELRKHSGSYHSIKIDL